MSSSSRAVAALLVAPTGAPRDRAFKPASPDRHPRRPMRPETAALLQPLGRQRKLKQQATSGSDEERDRSIRASLYASSHSSFSLVESLASSGSLPSLPPL